MRLHLRQLRVREVSKERFRRTAVVHLALLLDLSAALHLKLQLHHLLSVLQFLLLLPSHSRIDFTIETETGHGSKAAHSAHPLLFGKQFW